MINERTKAILRVILPIIFITYAYSITFFTHTHIVNGVTIVHSHPYLLDENGNPDHEHSGAEIQLIHHLSTFFAVSLIVSIILLGLFSQRKDDIPIYEYSFTPQNFIRHLSRLRAPPAFIV